MTLKLAKGLELPDEAVTQTIGILAKRGAGKSNAGAVLAEEMYAAGLQFVAIDPVGAWWGLQSTRDGKAEGLPIPVFGGHRGNIPLSPSGGELMADLVVDKRLSCVLDVSAFESENAKRRFLADFAERLFKQKGKPGSEEPLHLFLEEADDYVPQRATGEVARCLGAFERIVKRGRARGLGATMITQRSAALNKDVLTQIETLIALRTTSPQDRKAIEGWVHYHDTDDAIISSLSELAAGEAWVWSPEFLGVVKRVQIRRRTTFDSGATPKVGGQRRAPATVADIDLSELEKQMADTIERAKQDDPRELRRQLAEARAGMATMEKQLALSHEQEVREVITEVRVPVFDAEQVRALDELAEASRELAWKLESIKQWEPTAPAPPRQQAPTPRPASPAPPVPRGSTAAVTGDVTPSEQKVLDALAWLQVSRLYPAPKDRLAYVAGYKPSGGRWGNLIGGLSTRGFVYYPSPGLLAFTEAGQSLAQPPPEPLTVPEMHQLVLSKLTPSEQKVLQELLGIYPDGLSRDELARRSGYDAAGGRYGNLVGRLSSLGLVERPAPGFVRAAPVMFLE